MAEVSREVIVLIESQKIGRKMPNLELEWQAVNKLITDADIDEEIKRQSNHMV
ncbi:sugar metabolism transcriptional regulator [Actinobacillus equuli]|nr:sugar metabolism transcriptional regulator [Actinobacillus equuli]